jgi:branched-chain amino acid transport system ATP-binding protein
MAEPILSVEDLAVSFGSVRALDGVSLIVNPGEVLGLIGPNGSGKTTLFNCVSGFVRPARGSIRLGGEDVTGKPPEAIAGRGCFRTFQLVQLIDTLDVVENVLVGVHTQLRTGWVDHALGSSRSRREASKLRERALIVLEQLGLAGQEHAPILGLPFGIKRKVELARTLVADVRLLLLDEVSSGLNAGEQSELVKLIDHERRQRELSVVVVSHDMSFVDQLCDRVVVLSAGRLIAEGSQAQVQADPAVIAAYLETPHATEPTEASHAAG